MFLTVYFLVSILSHSWHRSESPALHTIGTYATLAETRCRDAGTMSTSACGFPLLVALPKGCALAIVASVDILHVAFALIAKSVVFDVSKRVFCS